MKDSTLLRTALITAITSLIALVIILDNSTIEEKQISKLTEEDLDRAVQVRGLVKEVMVRDKIVKIVIEQKSDLLVLMFTDQGTNIEEGDYVRITGELKQNNDELELIAETINHINTG